MSCMAMVCLMLAHTCLFRIGILATQFEVLFPALCELVDHVAENDLRGGQVLEALWVRSQTGVGAVRACMERYVAWGLVPVWPPQFPASVTQRSCRVYRLLYQCHQVLYNQIIAWMVHGTLIDTGSEFFVQLADGHRWSKRGADKAAVSSAALSATLASSKADAEAAEHDWNTRCVCLSILLVAKCALER